MSIIEKTCYREDTEKLEGSISSRDALSYPGYMADTNPVAEKDILISPSKSTTSRKIMIIEDDHIMSDLYKMILTQHGCSVVLVAEGAKEAIRSFEETEEKNRPQVAIVDNRLPDGWGIDVAARMLELCPNLNVILATADSVTEDTARQIGIKKLLRKPFAMDRLMQAVLADED